jgi:hypothetical protein
VVSAPSSESRRFSISLCLFRLPLSTLLAESPNLASSFSLVLGLDAANTHCDHVGRVRSLAWPVRHFFLRADGHDISLSSSSLLVIDYIPISFDDAADSLLLVEIRSHCNADKYINGGRIYFR